MFDYAQGLRKLRTLSQWELRVLVSLCEGSSVAGIAERYRQKRRTIEFVIGNCYDKLGLTFMSDLERQVEFANLANILAVAVETGSVDLPSHDGQLGNLSPEIPSQRSLAEVRNDARSGLWTSMYTNRRFGTGSDGAGESSTSSNPEHSADYGERDSTHQHSESDLPTSGDRESMGGDWGGSKSSWPQIAAIIVVLVVLWLVVSSLLNLVGSNRSSIPPPTSVIDLMPVLDEMPAGFMMSDYQRVEFTATGNRAEMTFEPVRVSGIGNSALFQISIWCQEWIIEDYPEFFFAGFSSVGSRESATRKDVGNLDGLVHKAAVVDSKPFNYSVGRTVYSTWLVLHKDSFVCLYAALSVTEHSGPTLIEIAKRAIRSEHRPEFLLR